MFHLGLATSAYIEREVSYTVITNFFCSLLVLKSSLPWEILSCASQSDTKKEENELRQLCILDHFQPELNFSRVNWSSARLVTSQNGKGDQHRPPTIYWVLVLASFSKATLSLLPTLEKNLWGRPCQARKSGKPWKQNSGFSGILYFMSCTVVENLPKILFF